MSESTTEIHTRNAEVGELDAIVIRHPLADILDNIEDLDPEFSQLITDNFWELV